jgi:ABC-2 type transport system ATP-binding protein
MSIVEIADLTKTYGPITAVDHFSLTLDKGEIVALVGPDGSGKTTVFRATCGLLDFDAGTITVAGLDVAREFEKVKSHLGYMPQIFSLYPDLSVEENLRFYAGIFGVGRREYARKRETLYAFSGLAPFAGRRAGALSGGMKQKLSLSCALVHDPDVLILDEPTAGVDPVSRQQFWDILRDLKGRGSAIAVATPYMDEVALSDRAVLVYGGRTLGAGTPEDLVRDFRGRVYRVGAALGADQLEALGRVEGIVSRRFGSAVYIHSEEAVAGATLTGSAVAARLRAAGVPPESLEEISPSLEEVFIQLMEGKR